MTCAINPSYALYYVCVRVCVLVCVAPPMVVGAWSVAGALRQLFEYYFYYALYYNDFDDYVNLPKGSSLL